MSYSATIYHLDGKEVHMLGDYVGVVWNTTRKKKTIKGEDGLTYEAYAPVRDGIPYIDFLRIRNKNGEVWEDEDSPVDGGLSGQEALQVAQELALAIEYLATVSG